MTRLRAPPALGMPFFSPGPIPAHCSSRVPKAAVLARRLAGVTPAAERPEVLEVIAAARPARNHVIHFRGALAALDTERLLVQHAGAQAVHLAPYPRLALEGRPTSRWRRCARRRRGHGARHRSQRGPV